MTTKETTMTLKPKSGKGSRKSSSLPGSTVEYLKNWILSPEHIAHPYPTEQEKAEIMEETGIEMKQLTNWFVNNRKRFWKPRVEARLQMQSQGTKTDTSSKVSELIPISPDVRVKSEPNVSGATPGLVHFDLPRTTSQNSLIATDISKALTRKDSSVSLNMISEASSHCSESASVSDNGDNSICNTNTDDYILDSFVKNDEGVVDVAEAQSTGQRSSQQSPPSSPLKKRVVTVIEDVPQATPRKKFRRSSLETWRGACEEASDVYCSSLPTLEEAARLFGYAN